MPTIIIKKKDLEVLLGQTVDLEKLPGQLYLVKGELKDYDESAGEIKVELNDTNRPDLWSVEGLARQIRIHRQKKPIPYPFYTTKKKPAGVVEVAKKIRAVRPYIGACIAKGLKIDEETLVQLIQVQEKLSESFGRKRRLVSIGLYRLKPIKFPIYYKTVRPQSTRFVPLGFEESLSLKEILDKHPKGIAYRETIGSATEYPLLVDSEGKVLSFPPIINSKAIGEVRVGDRDLFIEVTGTDLRMVVLTVNILAANLFDRGAEIQPVEIKYPYSTKFGRKITMPMPIAGSLTVRPEDFLEALGETVSLKDAASTLVRYGYSARTKGKKLEVSVPPFRDDLLHPIDVVEDYAISRGYDSFEPRMPSEFSIGGLTPIERFSDRVRDSMVGMGFQETLSNILADRVDFRKKMRLTDAEGQEKIVAVANVMSQTYSILRDAIVPALLRVESTSSKSFYPHRIFEVGETARIDPDSPEGTRTDLHLGAFIAHPGSNFSEMHSVLDLLMYYIEKEYSLVPVVHPSYLAGRVGRIHCGGHDLGLIGEIHPEVLENWHITMPCSAFELRLDSLISSKSGK